MKIVFHLGKRSPDYRTLMREQSDFEVDGRVIKVNSLVIAEQTHSNLVHVCTEKDSGAGLGIKPQISIADGFVTNIPDQFLLIRTADCTPVIMYDPVKMVVAAVHSGREGTRKNIAGEACRIMNQAFNCDSSDIIAYIGAGICHKHYEVSEAVFEEYNASLLAMDIHPVISLHRHIDIRSGIFQQLIRSGIPFKNIENIFDCTYEDDNYHSYRREGSHNRQINLVGIVYE